ncbi:hypothetical protein ACLVWU_13740 [Bdellovibrio sp. HCB290]|uniref:hypothetical protein n=1 Tax=Bdellovibrio sp. HCB290 TaxID=3394356 RepID=UPI0039B58C77
MIKVFAVSGLIFLSTFAHAQKEVVVTCKGSLNPNMKPQEKYSVVLNEVGDVVLEGQDAKSSQIYVKVDSLRDIKRNDDFGLNLESTKRQMGMVLSRQSIDIDYKTGKGLAQDTLTFNGGSKPRSIYLASCAR